MEHSHFLSTCIAHGIFTSELRKQISKRKLDPSPSVCVKSLETELENAKQTLNDIEEEIRNLLHNLNELNFVGFVKYSKETKHAMEETKRNA